MKKALDYIVSHRSIAITILFIILFVLFFLIPKCSDNIREKKVECLSLKSILNQQKNQLETKYMTDLAEVARALQIKEAENGKLIAKNNKLLKAESDKKVIEARKNTNITEPCKDAIDSQERTIEGLEKKATSDSTQLVIAATGLNIAKTMTEKVTQDYQTVLIINEDLRKAVKRTWYERNDKWIYSGVAVVGTFLILR